MLCHQNYVFSVSYFIDILYTSPFPFIYHIFINCSLGLCVSIFHLFELFILSYSSDFPNSYSGNKLVYFTV